MPYLGNPAVDRFTSTKAASVYSGDGSTVAFTLEHSVGADEDILVSVDGVIQEPSVAYAVSSGTTLTFTAAPSTNSGNNIFVYYLFRTIGTVTHPPTSALSATSLNTSGNVVHNEAGADVDFRVESDTVTHALFVDGASGKVGIGTSSPSSILHLSSSLPILSFTDTDDSATSRVYQDSESFVIDVDNANAKASSLFKVHIDNTEALKIDANGHVTMPLQPAFLATSSSQSNIASTDTLAFPNEVFDQNADYNNSNYRFTAPVTGRYQINATVRVDSLDQAATYSRIFLKTSNRNYETIFSLGGLSGDPAYWTMVITALADMDAGDIAYLDWSQSGGASQADIGVVEATFSGYLAC